MLMYFKKAKTDDFFHSYNSRVGCDLKPRDGEEL